MADEENTGCLAGCDRTPRAPEVMPTPGQLLHSLHTKSREEQLDSAQRMLDASDSAVRCFTRDHERRLARDDEERALLLWLHAEAVWIAQHESDNADQWCADLERVESSRQAWAEEAMRLDTIGETLLTAVSKYDDRLRFVASRYLADGSGLNLR